MVVPNFRFLCVVSDGGDSRVVKMTSMSCGAVLNVALERFMSSATLAEAMPPSADIGTSFELLVPQGYLEAWMKASSVQRDKLLLLSVRILAKYLKASDFLADANTTRELGWILGPKLLLDSVTKLAKQQGKAVQCCAINREMLLQLLCSLSSDAVLAVLKSSPASLPQQLEKIPTELYDYAVQAALPSLQCDGILVVDSSHFIFKNAAVRFGDSERGSLHPFEACLHAAVRTKITKLTLDGCSMQPACLHRLLTAASQNTCLMSLDITFASKVHSHVDRHSKRSIPYDIFTSDAVLWSLAQLTSLQSLTLQTAGDRTQLGLSEFSDTCPPSAGSCLGWALHNLTLLTHLSIAYLMEPAEAAEFLPYLTALQSLNIGLVHNNGVFVDDAGPFVYQLDAKGSNEMANSLASLTALRKVTLHASVMHVADLPLPQWYRKDGHHTFDAVAKGLSRNSALEELRAVLPQHETRAAMGALSAVVEKMKNLQALCLSQLGAAENVMKLANIMMIAQPYASLTRLRIDGAYTQYNDMRPIRGCGCVALCKLLAKLPALVDVRMQFLDHPRRGLAERLSVLPRGLERLESLELKASAVASDGCAELAEGILSICVPKNLHTLIVSIGSNMSSNCRENTQSLFKDQRPFARLQQYLAAATCLQDLRIKHRHGQLKTSHKLQDCFCGLTTLTFLSLDLWCADSCLQQLFPKLVQLSHLRTLELSFYGKLHPDDDLDANMIDQKSAAALSVALRAMRKLSELKLHGWTFHAGTSAPISHLASALTDMTHLEVLELNSGERKPGSSFTVLADCLRGHKSLRKLVTGPWHIDQASASMLSDALREVPTLRELDLSNTIMRDECAKCIADLLKAAPNVMAVHVSERGLTEKGAQCLVDALAGDPIRCPALWNLPEKIRQAHKKQHYEARKIFSHEVSGIPISPAENCT